MPLMYARAAGQAESARLLEQWSGQPGRLVKVRPSRVECGAVVMATTKRYAAVVVASGVLRAARQRTAAAQPRPGMARTV
jgi:hypothetical protein